MYGHTSEQRQFSIHTAPEGKNGYGFIRKEDAEVGLREREREGGEACFLTLVTIVDPTRYTKNVRHFPPFTEVRSLNTTINRWWRR